MKFKHDLKKSLLVTGLCVLLLSALFTVGFFSNIQLKLTDNLYGGRLALDNIVIVAIDDKSLQEIGRWPWDRSVFATTIEKLSSAKVVGMDVAFFESTNAESDTLLAEALSNAGNVVLPVRFTSFEQRKGRIVGKNPLYPLPQFRNVTQTGYVNIQTDRDGITRSVNLDISGDINSFASAMFQNYRAKAPVSYESRFLINYVDKPGTFTRYSLTDVNSGVVDTSTFDNKIVFIGATAPDLHDDYFVPTSSGVPMPGVEIHANTLQTLITNRFISYEPTLAVILSILVFALLTLWLLMNFSIRITGMVLLLVTIGYVFVAIKIFDTYGIILNIIYIPLTNVFAYSGLVTFFYVTESRARKFISDAFGKFVSPVVIEQLIENPEKLKLGGETREITVFFSDIRGFTGISEILTPEQLVHFLNDYLTEMTNIILDSEGTVDKYMGDAIMAFWNAPLDQSDHPHRAAQSALDQMKRLKELQKLWEKDGLPYLDIGIGLNTGKAVVGNMGSYDRFDYTGMGDTINLGSRLEGVNKQYGTNIIVSNVTHDLIKDKFLTRPLDRIRVKGRKAPLMIFELLESHAHATLEMKEFAAEFEEALRFYYDQKFRRSESLFKQLQKKYKNSIHSAQTTCQLYIDRCKDFLKHPPGRDWDGVYTMVTK